MAFVQILLFLALGLFLRRFGGLAQRLLPILIQTVLWACIPALALLKLPVLKLSLSTLFPALLAWLIFAGAFGLSQIWFRQRYMSQASATALCLTMGLGNTSFVGFPLISALLGSEALPPALIMDQAGSFLILGTWGLLCLAQAEQAGVTQPEQQKKSPPMALEMVLKLLRFPPFLAFGTGLLMWATGLSLQGPWQSAAAFLAGCLAPLALTAVGLQLDFQPDPGLNRLLAMGLGYKLIVAPAGALLLCLGLGLPSELTRVCVLEAGMGPMITSALMAAAAGLHPSLATRMVGLGVPLSLLSVPLWWGLLQILLRP